MTSPSPDKATTRRRVIRVHPDDNAVIVLDEQGLKKGTEIKPGIVLVEDIPQAHKVALAHIAKGAPVLRYGTVIGTAAADIAAGAWITEDRLVLPDAPGFDDLPIATSSTPLMPPLEGYAFEGYRNRDGTVGTRNLLAITTTVQCVTGVVAQAVDRIRRELLPRYANVDGVVGLDHVYGCGVAIDAPDAPIPIRTLANIARNPNFGGETMVVALGCEKLQPERLIGALPPADRPDGIGLVTLQDPAHVGFEAMITSILRTAEAHLQSLDRRRRTTCPASDLVVGIQCGGSDAFSGITANPALGQASDLLIRAGATVMFSENTEVRDGIAQLTARAANPEVARRIIEELAWYDRYLARGSVDRSANTTPGNKRGGLSNIVEKAMGSIVKSGTAPINGVVAPG
ncbi:MAG: galactarate dehydratase, partial [Alphaproteobacteria bacterium]|nr:galactarate dehydratase [Alphaproteobacteria bacterium]